jgi:hypothetical protein
MSVPARSQVGGEQVEEAAEATMLLGAGGDARETLGRVYAAQAGRMAGRAVVVGIGLRRVDESREGFFDVVELLRRVLGE